MVHAILHSKGIVRSTTAPVSAGLLRQTTAYFDALDAYRRGDARPIIERFADACRFAARAGSALVDEFSEQIGISRQKLAGLRPQAGAWAVLPHLIGQPVLNARFVVDRLGLSDVAAQRALAALAEYGVVEERTGLRRNRVWQNSGIVRVLDAFAQQLRSG